MSKNPKKPELDIADVESLTFEAMRRYGMIPPMTLDEVAAIEAELDDVELPFQPKNPTELLSSSTRTRVENASRVSQEGIELNGATRNRALAARKGGEISEAAESKMAEDKATHLRNGDGRP